MQSGVIWKDRYIAELVCFAPALISTGRQAFSHALIPKSQRLWATSFHAQHPAINHLEQHPPKPLPTISCVHVSTWVIFFPPSSLSAPLNPSIVFFHFHFLSQMLNIRAVPDSPSPRQSPFNSLDQPTIFLGLPRSFPLPHVSQHPSSPFVASWSFWTQFPPSQLTEGYWMHMPQICWRLWWIEERLGMFSISNLFFHSFTHCLVLRTLCSAIRSRAPISRQTV